MLSVQRFWKLAAELVRSERVGVFLKSIHPLETDSAHGHPGAL